MQNKFENIKYETWLDLFRKPGTDPLIVAELEKYGETVPLVKRESTTAMVYLGPITLTFKDPVVYPNIEADVGDGDSLLVGVAMFVN